ncbi:MAG: VanW family protein [Armatimonadota bacterium]
MDAAKKQQMIKWTLVVLGAVVVVAIAAGITLVIAARDFVHGDEIARNVSIAGVEVGGMTQAEALETLHTEWVPSLPSEITLEYPDGDTRISPEELGVRLKLKQTVAAAYCIGREGNWYRQVRAYIRMHNRGVDVPVECEVDETSLRKVLVELSETINRSPKDADVDIENDTVNVTPGVVGRTLDVDESQAMLAEKLQDPHCKTAELVVRTEQPAITEEDLAHFETVLAKYHTPFNINRRDRTHNLRLAMSIVNETVLKPGEEFSLNEHVGPRLTEKGYRAAPIFLRGEVVPSTGGGVCQVASTLYNVALLANLKITERHHHSRPVDYTPSGRDATVYYGQLDLKFKNTLKYPVLIVGYIEGSNLHAKIIGAKEDDYDVKLVRSGLSTIGYQTKEKEDPELEESKREVETKGRSGHTATITRIVEKDGEVIKKEVLHRDVYSPQTEIVRVGTKKPEEPDEEPEEAETGGLSTTQPPSDTAPSSDRPDQTETTDGDDPQ